MTIIMHALVLLCQTANDTEVPSFTDSKDMIWGIIFNKLALYGTDGRLFATDVGVKFKAT